jgi:uncharacterized membrane protein YphA (DoxX/SURF4 family)
MIDSRTAPYAAFVLRIALGAMFIAHSLILKHFTFTLPGTAQFFESLGLGSFSAASPSLVQALLGDGRFALANLLPASNLRLRVQS